MARTTKDPDERRSELVASAQRLFYTQGYERTSVRDIVDAVSVAKGTFYYYFDSKQAVLEAVVEAMLTQVLGEFEAIVDDPSLNAIQKWTRVVKLSNDWKIERKAELLALQRVMQSDDNVPLIYRLQKRKLEKTVPLFASIIEQGVAEGVFETAYVKETARFVYVIARAISENITDILLHPDRYDHPEAQTRRKFAAMETAIERVLRAEPGSLPIADEQMLAPWFED